MSIQDLSRAIDLRFVKRILNGQAPNAGSLVRILQCRYPVYLGDDTYGWTEWEDVPCVESDYDDTPCPPQL